MPPDVPHFVRVARALALASGLATAGCGASTGPLVDEDASAPGCPSPSPRPGSPCAEPGRSCDYAPGRCVSDAIAHCRCYADGARAFWRCGPNCIVGPLPPPDLPG